MYQECNPKIKIYSGCYNHKEDVDSSGKLLRTFVSITNQSNCVVQSTLIAVILETSEGISNNSARLHSKRLSILNLRLWASSLVVALSVNIKQSVWFRLTVITDTLCWIYVLRLLTGFIFEQLILGNKLL